LVGFDALRRSEIDPICDPYCAFSVAVATGVPIVMSSIAILENARQTTHLQRMRSGVPSLCGS
jgi:hypothetical protein